MKTSTAKLIILVLACMAPAVAAADSIAVRTSHTEAVGPVEYLSGRGLLVTGGDDGKVKIWQEGSGALLAGIQASHLPIRQIAVHPSRPEFVAVSSDGAGEYLLHVWNWAEGREIAFRRLADDPFFIRYSDRGTYLFYGLPQWNSLTFLAGETGNEIPYLREGFGFVSFAVTSADERTLVTYTPSNGRIIYWDLTTGRQILDAPVSTVRNLSELRAIGRLFFAGMRGDSLVIVNNFTGQTVAERVVAGLESFAVRPSAGSTTEFDIGAFGHDGEDPRFEIFRFDGRELRSTFFSSRLLPENATVVAFFGEDVVSGDETGTIRLHTGSIGRAEIFAGRTTESIDSIAFARDRLFMTVGRSLRMITSDLFLPRPPGPPEIATLSISDRQTEMTGEIFLSPMDETALLAWSENPPTLSKVSAISRAFFDRLEAEDAAPLVSVHAESDFITTVDERGRLALLDGDNYDVIFEYQAPGLRTAVNTEFFGIIAGKGATSRFDSALIAIDPATGETVPIPTAAFVVFDVVFDSRSRTLYTLGLARNEGRIETILSLHYGRNLDSNRVIYRYPAERVTGSILVDEEEGVLYTTATERGIAAWDGAEFRLFAAAGHHPEQLAVQAGIVYGRNRDGTLTAWLAETGEVLFDFYLFSSSEWLAMGPGGMFLESREGVARRYLSFVPEGNRSLDAYRLRLPILNRER